MPNLLLFCCLDFFFLLQMLFKFLLIHPYDLFNGIGRATSKYQTYKIIKIPRKGIDIDICTAFWITGKYRFFIPINKAVHDATLKPDCFGV